MIAAKCRYKCVFWKGELGKYVKSVCSTNGCETGGPQSYSECFGGEGILFCLLGIETCYLVLQPFA
jgi:hypothetical protein